MHGRGGFAWVFAARRSGGGPPVALKVLPPHYAGDAGIEERFRREARIAADLCHPNVVRILDVGHADGFGYFAMPLYPHSLGTLLEEHGMLEERRVARIGRDVAAGLACAHDAGMVHRDVKPANILLPAAGAAVLADFGIARTATGTASATAASVTLGTPQYTSPEQAQGHPLDGRSDVYSLGVVLFRAATGDVPFRSTDWFELARKHVEEPPPGARTKVPELTRRFDRIVSRCLAKHPADRFRSADDLAAELEALAGP